jgi:hypothetical protein
MMLRNMNYGRVPNPLPYTMQDGYTRHLQPRDFRVAVLENEVLRATFLLEFGGRMWSLVHKPSGRELLAVNPVFRLANLAIRNAWFSLLEEAAHGGRMNWLRWLHLGVMRYYIGDRLSARQAWEASLNDARTPWALRNLAFLAYEEGWLDEAADLYIAACQMCPSLLPLAVECGEVLIDMDRAREWLDLLHAFPQSVRTVGRIRLLEGWAALAVRDFERVAHLFSRKLIVPDLREGERSLSQLWFAFHEQRLSAKESVPVNAALRSRVRWQFPVPPEIDFRMSDDVSTNTR